MRACRPFLPVLASERLSQAVAQTEKHVGSRHVGRTGGNYLLLQARYKPGNGREKRGGNLQKSGRDDANPDAMRTRRETVEHPFGTIKARMGATHFLMKRRQNGAACPRL
jgi:hypothetical protein